MPDRSRKRSRDANVAAWQVVQEATGEKPKVRLPTEQEVQALVERAIAEGKDPAAVLLGRKGGLKGGKARAARMTPKERSEAARKAARARWGSRD